MMVSYGRNPENRIIARSRRLSRAAMGMAGRFLPIRFRMVCAADVQTRLSSNLRFCCRPANSCSCRAGSRLPDLSQSQKRRRPILFRSAGARRILFSGLFSEISPEASAPSPFSCHRVFCPSAFLREISISPENQHPGNAIRNPHPGILRL